MKNFLEEYLKQKFKSTQEVFQQPGPVLTISREFGCEAQDISRKLKENLNTYHQPIAKTQKWEIISKEILEESAKELQIDSKKIEYVFNFETRTSMDDFLMSLTSRQYHSDWKVRDTIKNVIRAFAFKGNAIIIGRAGAQITRDIENSLHVRLSAPREWRVGNICKKYNLSEKLASKKVTEMDDARRKLIEMFWKNADCENCYDVFYNPKFLSTDQIVSDIIHMMQLKKLI